MFKQSIKSIINYQGRVATCNLIKSTSSSSSFGYSKSSYSSSSSSSYVTSDKMKDKVCFVTGGAAGIGLGVVERFVKEGAKVAIVDLNGELATKVSNEINQKYPNSTIPVQVDISQDKDVKRGIEDTVAKFGGLDVVVSNAGFQHIQAIDELELDNWKKMLGVHLDGSFLCAKYGIKEFKKDIKRGGSIIFMGSVHSKYASDLKSPYVTAKHGLEGLTRSVAREGAKYNVKSNLICPGFVRTALVERQIPEISKRLSISEEDVIKTIMLKDTVDGEFTTVQDVAEVAVFFASMPNKSLTGQSLIVSHGWIME
ncbi:Beta-hydroxybutyrate dehydrogenase [Cavenderia fasciculata]|uniref:3-oxoacyl-[acyl-carrier-protein] reductase n=1 Tax=Cavenderia fasciculata TaxID=261658 RepID=F4QFI4_CACFS|nr:Beta-hydroxybutyrate dehydrogenase [Cavenderia fasciculata]EGG14285.1 Beta-hydroxybutyrate dehydrogenase [Cavenderia fasciculata]|eukprot:XP_004350994.1 Beta-hydroxybutyrate dehydrogenase [Cavenderia fasciculata]